MVHPSEPQVQCLRICRMGKGRSKAIADHLWIRSTAGLNFDGTNVTVWTGYDRSSGQRVNPKPSELRALPRERILASAASDGISACG
jgi:hypothetical protein